MSFIGRDGTAQASLSTTVQSAALVVLPSTGAPSAIWLPQNSTPLQRTVDLESVQGDVGALGRVVMTAASGVLPANPLTFGQAVTDAVLAAPVNYDIGSIINFNPGPGLEPTSFDFAIQSNGSGTGAALLLLITTSGQPGTAGPLPTYPLSSGVTAALLISDEILFNAILPGALIAQFGSTITVLENVQLIGQRRPDASWETIASAGIANFGPLLAQYTNNLPENMLAITGTSTMASCNAPLSGNGSSFIATNASGSLQLAWTARWNQSWTYGPMAQGTIQAGAMEFTYSCVASPSLNPTTDIVTFTGHEVSTFGPDLSANPPANWMTTFFNPPNLVAVLYQNGLNQIFNGSFFPSLQIASINTFSLANLVFPENNQLTLKGIQFPGDLLLSGNLVAMTEVFPVTATVASGGTVQFAASAAIKSWGVRASGGAPGRIEQTSPTTARYHAPNVINTRTVVVTANHVANEGATRAQVTVVPANLSQSLVVTPAAVVLGASQGSVTITVTDQNGNPANVTCALGAGESGSLTAVSTGVWQYQTTQPTTGQVTVTARSITDPSQHGTSTIFFGTRDNLTVAWDDGSPGNDPNPVAPGATLQLSAVSSTGYEPICWAILPPGSDGTIVASSDDSTQATLIAPTVAGTGYRACAYYADMDVPAVGYGQVQFSVNPTE